MLLFFVMKKWKTSQGGRGSNPLNPPPWIHLYEFTIVGTCWKEALFGIGGTSKQMTSKGGVIIRMGASIGRMALNYSSSGLVSIPAPTPCQSTTQHKQEINPTAYHPLTLVMAMVTAT